MYYHVKELTETGSCAWSNCKETGNKWLQGKCYCERHYAILIRDDKPVGKPAMGASTTIINEGTP